MNQRQERRQHFSLTWMFLSTWRTNLSAPRSSRNVFENISVDSSDCIVKMITSMVTFGRCILFFFFNRDLIDRNEDNSNTGDDWRHSCRHWVTKDARSHPTQAMLTTKGERNTIKWVTNDTSEHSNVLWTAKDTATNVFRKQQRQPSPQNCMQSCFQNLQKKLIILFRFLGKLMKWTWAFPQ